VRACSFSSQGEVCNVLFSFPREFCAVSLLPTFISPLPGKESRHKHRSFGIGIPPSPRTIQAFAALPLLGPPFLSEFYEEDYHFPFGMAEKCRSFSSPSPPPTSGGQGRFSFSYLLCVSWHSNFLNMNPSFFCTKGEVFSPSFFSLFFRYEEQTAAWFLLFTYSFQFR